MTSRTCNQTRAPSCEGGKNRGHIETLTAGDWAYRLPNLLSNGAVLAGFARRLRYYQEKVAQVFQPQSISRALSRTHPELILGSF